MCFFFNCTVVNDQCRKAIGHKLFYKLFGDSCWQTWFSDRSCLLYINNTDVLSSLEDSVGQRSSIYIPHQVEVFFLGKFQFFFPIAKELESEKEWAGEKMRMWKEHGGWGV